MNMSVSEQDDVRQIPHIRVITSETRTSVGIEVSFSSGFHHQGSVVSGLVLHQGAI